MFTYSFAAMTAYNIVQPVTRSAFITTLGADNIPYVLFATGLLIGFIMQFYSGLIGRLPQRWAIPIVLLGLTGLLLTFWMLLREGSGWVSAGFYLFGQVLGTLLLSQFWTVANDVYNPRQARRLYGFIGGGASLGGMAGSGLAAVLVEPVGTDALLLFSAAALVATAGVVVFIVRPDTPTGSAEHAPEGAPAGGFADAWRLMRESPGLRQIAALISFAAFGAVLIDQQLNMAAEQFRGDEDTITSFLASVRFLLSTTALLIQVLFVKQIYRRLGVGFALLMLPMSLGVTATLTLISGALWAPAVASVVDQSIRYTVDRTTREIFFLPLPPTVRQRAKSFVDVTVDRIARGAAAVLILVLIKPWGLALGWPQLSIVTLVVVALWSAMALRAKTRYIATVRKGLETQVVQPTTVRLDVADLTTVEALLEELAHPDEHRVLYAIDMLEALDKRNLVTPLLLHHASPAVRARAVGVLGGSRPAIARRWQSMIHKLVDDPDPEVRAKAIVALATVRNEDATRLARTLVNERSPRMATSAAVVLAGSGNAADAEIAEATLSRLATDTRQSSMQVRRDVASAIRQIADPRCRHVLIPLLQDREPEVAEEAMRSVRTLRPLDPLFVPTLISLLGNRRLKSGARDTLVGYGEPVLEMLGYVVMDQDEDIWVRRHVPATVAQLPCQDAMDLMGGLLDDPDQFLRYKAIAAMAVLRRRRSTLACQREPLERLLMTEARGYFEYLILRHDVFDRGGMPTESLLAQVLTELTHRAVARAYRLLALLHPWKDIAAAIRAIERGDGPTRAQAFEYLDNILAAHLRQAVLPMLEDLPSEEKVRHGHAICRTHPRGLEDSLLALINDADEVAAAAAIELAGSQHLVSLTADIEHVLAHRDARDWFVFEAASWTLARHRLSPEDQRARWLEPLPSIVLADRLRHLAMFSSVTIDEICRLVARGRQTRYDDGAVLLREGVPPTAFHVLLDGHVATQGRATPARELEAPGLLGFEPALEARPAPETARAVGPVVTLGVSREELLAVLAGNTDLVQGLFRTIAESTAGTKTPPVMAGTAVEDLTSFDTGELTLIQKIVALQQTPIFAGVASAELARLGAIAQEVSLQAGAVYSDETDSPVMCVVLEGALSLRDPETQVERYRAGVGDAVGVFETLAGTRHGAVGRDPLRLVVASSASVLRIDRDDLFDLISQRPRLLQQLFSTLFGTHAPTARV